VAIAPNGDIFVAEGHAPTFGNSRIMKFDKTGKFIKTFGHVGSGDGEFKSPHVITFDSQGRLFVADRSNSRVDIFDQDGKFLAVETVRAAERHLDRQERCALRVRFRIGGCAWQGHEQSRLQARRAHRQREDGEGGLLHPAASGVGPEAFHRRKVSPRFPRQHLPRGGAGEAGVQVRQELTDILLLLYRQGRRHIAVNRTRGGIVKSRWQIQ